jgi:hypothetical protein
MGHLVWLIDLRFRKVRHAGIGDNKRTLNNAYSKQEYEQWTGSGR